MIKKSTKALGIATATLSLAGALVAPQAMAQTQAERVADATAKKTAALEAQVNQMASMMQAMQAELSRVKETAGGISSAKVLELDQWMASVKNAPAAAAAKDNKVSVRGGFVGFNEGRGSTAGGAGGRYAPGLHQPCAAELSCHCCRWAGAGWLGCQPC